MTEVAIGTIAVVAVALAGQAATLLMWWKTNRDRRAERVEDHREWYRRTMFEKRVLAHQEEHAWLLQLRRAVVGIDRENLTAPANEQLRRVSREAREWYDLSALLLHNELFTSSSFVGVCNSANEVANGEPRSLFFQMLEEADDENRNRAKSVMSAERQAVS